MNAKICIFSILYCLSLTVVAQKKANIVIIISDDHAYQTISAYNHSLMQTPNIDRIAKEGAIFRKGYVTNSICGPSRAVILTGKYSHKNGFKDNIDPNFNGNQDSFIKQLHQNGYLTAWIGKWHLGSEPQGFDYWNILAGQGSYYNSDFISPEGKKRKVGYVANVIEDEAEKWLDLRDTSKPFCLIIGHKNTHRTWMPAIEDYGAFDNKYFSLPYNFYDDYSGRKAAAIQDMSIEKTMILGYDLKMFPSKNFEEQDGNISRMNAEQRTAFNAYYDSVKKAFFSLNLSGNKLAEWKFQRYMKDYLSTVLSLDRNVGRTLDYLDQHGLTDNTLVIYLSDQGFYMGEHGWFDKRFMYEESFRTPLLMRYPAKIKPGTVSNDLVMNIDIAPTVLEVAGVSIPKDMQGKSLLPVFTNSFQRDAMYYHYYEKGEHNVSPHFGISNGKFKLIRFYDLVNSWELYDLENDPHEMNNIYGEKKYKRVQQEMKEKLWQLIKYYEDEAAKAIFDEKLK